MLYKNLSDCHTHSLFSHDGIEKIEDMCDRAKEIGLINYAVTDHCEIDDYAYPEFQYYRDRVHSAYDAMTEKKEIYPFLLSGIELAQPLQNIEAVNNILNGRNYDFVIGSVHRLETYEDFAYWDTQPYRGVKLWTPETLPREKALERYLLDLLEIAKWGKTDTIAHLTYPLRYMRNADGSKMNFDSFHDIIREIYRAIIQSGIALEMNTSGLRQDIGEVLPNTNFLKMYKDVGGELITIGSDAHTVPDLGKGLKEGFDILENIGFKYYAVYKNRKATMISVE
ncbi:MAG: histidinol-phosphatase HisJ family protein [Clostridia bacterium]